MKVINLSRIWPALERYVMRRSWTRLTRRATDRTADLSRHDCLVLAPHPDDETLGCGGLVMRKRAAGQAVHVAVVTDGAATGAAEADRGAARADMVARRAQETTEACERLGVDADHLRFFDFPDGALADHAEALRTRIAQAVAEITPSEIYVCALDDGHRDHVALARVVRALHAEGGLGAASLWEYPVWFWDFRSWRPDGATNKAGFVSGVQRLRLRLRALNAVTVDITGLEHRKRDALACHKSQVGALADRDWSGLPRNFLAFFLRDKEVFFEVRSATKRAEVTG